MRITTLGTATVSLAAQVRWVWYSPRMESFIVGDDRAAFAVPVGSPGNTTALIAAREFENQVPPRHPCNLPVPQEAMEEMAQADWHGFRFLNCADCERFGSGDLLRTIVFGPDYGHPLVHPASGVVMSFRKGAMEIFAREGEGFKQVDKAKPRGRATLAYAAHPSESLIAYGDNGGTFHAHRFEIKGFDKATKIAAKERNASRVEFVRGGKTLLVGGMGYLASFSYDGGKFVAGHEVSIPVRDFVCADDGQVIFVNQGMHGIAVYRLGDGGFEKVMQQGTVGAVQQMRLSEDGKYLGVTTQDQMGMTVYSIGQ